MEHLRIVIDVSLTRSTTLTCEGIGRFAVTDNNNKHFFPDFFLVIDAKHGRYSKGDVYNSSKLVMSLNQ